jgi:hypothetical protein
LLQQRTVVLLHLPLVRILGLAWRGVATNNK